MKSSVSSSATGTALKPRPAPTDTGAPATARPDARTGEPVARKRFALTGPSVRLDERANAVRRDLADVRLADRVFAPHYAAPLPRLVIRATALNAAREAGAERVADLDAGERFEVLELSGGKAWGVAPGRGLVGYLDADALTAPA